MHNSQIVKKIWGGGSLAASLFCVAASAAIPMAANAASVTIDSVQQRWPWNNKVDITYSVTDGQDVANSHFCYIIFTAYTNGVEFATIDGRHDVGANASSGTHTVTWTPPSGVKCDSCTMRATLYSGTAPSGDDYMIVDLASGEVTYEGLLASQAASNSRYNADTSGTGGKNIYKTTKLVLRKVPRWADRASLPNASTFASLSGYPTGDDKNYADSNSAAFWVTDKTYYIGVFHVTQAQYVKLLNSNPTSSNWRGDYKPVTGFNRVQGLRNTSVATDAVVPDSTSTKFFPKLNGRTSAASGMTGFDLPTEVMQEIACRAGATTTYFWSDADDTSTYSHSGNNYNVGVYTPNVWGLYDMVGNVWNGVRDDGSLGNLANAKDAFTPAYDSSATTWRVKGATKGGGSANYSSTTRRASHRFTYPLNSGNSAYVGFRVAIVME